MHVIDLPSLEEDSSSQVLPAGPSNVPPSLNDSDIYLSARAPGHSRSLSTSSFGSERSCEGPVNSEAGHQTSCNSGSKLDDSEDPSDISLNVEDLSLEDLDIPSPHSNESIWVNHEDEGDELFVDALPATQALESAIFRITNRRERIPSMSKRRATPQDMCATLKVINSVHFDVSLDYRRTGSQDGHLVNTQHPCDQLRDFTWTSAGTGINEPLPRGFPWRNLKVDLPWHQLTNISMQCPLYIEDIHQILSRSSNLKSLALEFWSSDRRLSVERSTSECMENGAAELPSAETSPSPSPITSSTLQTLSISTNADLHSLFKDVNLPALTHLSLDTSPNAMGLTLYTEAKAPLDASLNVPWERLEDLSIQYHVMKPCSLSPILARLRSIRKLSLDGLYDVLQGSPPAIQFSQLDTLNLGRTVACTPVLAALSAVNICSLTMFNSGFDVEYLKERMTKHLTLHATISPNDLFDILGSVSSLKTAEFNIAAFTDRDLREVVRTSLRSLTIKMTAGGDPELLRQCIENQTPLSIDFLSNATS